MKTTSLVLAAVFTLFFWGNANANPAVALACAQNAQIARLWAEKLRPNYTKEGAAQVLLTPLAGAEPDDERLVATLKGIELVWAVPHKTPEQVRNEFQAWCVKQFSVKTGE